MWDTIYIYIPTLSSNNLNEENDMDYYVVASSDVAKTEM